jgi:serine/threonine protein phosphatase PrpC
MCGMTEATTRVEAYGGIQIGEPRSRARDYVFVAERDVGQCALLAGRELRHDWKDRDSTDTPAAVEVLAHADDLFLPLASGTPEARLDRFRRGFRHVVNQSQQELQRDADQQHGEAPSLTITLAYIDGRRLYVGHVGDSRCYVLRNNALHRMTTDHTASTEPATKRLVSDPMSSRKVMNVVGGFSEDLEIETIAVDLRVGDMVLVCTPGVATAVPDGAIEEVLSAGSRDPSMPLDAVAQNLLRAVPEHLRSADRAVALARLRDRPQSKNGQLQ